MQSLLFKNVIYAQGTHYNMFDFVEHYFRNNCEGRIVVSFVQRLKKIFLKEKFSL